MCDERVPSTHSSLVCYFGTWRLISATMGPIEYSRPCAGAPFIKHSSFVFVDELKNCDVSGAVQPEPQVDGQAHLVAR